MPEARSALDSLARLLPARGAGARGARKPSSRRRPGFPVFVELDVTSTSSTESAGDPVGHRAPAEARETRTRRSRAASRTSPFAPGAAADEALFSVPEDFRRAASTGSSREGGCRERARPRAAPRRSSPELLAGRPLAVLTGAGVSAESGLSDVPRARRAVGREPPRGSRDTRGVRRRIPRQVWRFYEWRVEKLRNARPNAGHVALARMERILPRMTLVTQNVDGLHAAAGSRNIIELHGTILDDALHGCGRRSAGARRPVPAAPAALRCGGAPAARRRLVRGDAARRALEAAAQAAAESAVFLVVGTSSVVAPASSLATDRGARAARRCSRSTRRRRPSRRSRRAFPGERGGGPAGDRGRARAGHPVTDANAATSRPAGGAARGETGRGETRERRCLERVPRHSTTRSSWRSARHGQRREARHGDGAGTPEGWRLPGLFATGADQLRQLARGVGIAKATRVGAVLELGRRLSHDSLSKKNLLSDPVSVGRYLSSASRARRRRSWAASSSTRRTAS